jgi:hypothetical protein
MNAKSRRCLTNQGSGGKGWNFIIPFVRKHIQTSSVEFRPNKQFEHSRIDGAVEYIFLQERGYKQFLLYPTAEKVGFVIPSFHNVLPC